MAASDKNAGLEPAPTPAPAPAGMGRRSRAVLIASLALNLVFLGALAGAGLDRARHHDGPPASAELGLGPFTEALSGADRRALRRGYMAQAPSFEEDRQRWRAEAASMVAALRDEPYDQAAVEAAADAMTAGMAGRLDLAGRLLLARIAEMDAAERQGFADRLEAALARAGRRDGGRRGGD